MVSSNALVSAFFLAAHILFVTYASGNDKSQRFRSCDLMQQINQEISFKNGFRFWENKIWLLGCASLHDKLLPALTKIWRPKSEHLNLLHVGASKGYVLAKWVHAWAPEMKKGPSEWGKKLHSWFLEKFLMWRLCGNCNDCGTSFQSGVSSKGSRNFNFIAVEPDSKRFHLLKRFQNWTGLHENIDVIHSAASNQSGVGKFIESPNLGYESSRLLKDDREAKKQVAVPVHVTTVDEICMEFNMNFLHYLKISAEGNDPLVLQGGERALKEQKVGLLEFEYSRKGAWIETSLEDVISYLDTMSYVCFLQIKLGKKKASLLQLTNCWTVTFEFHRWSNVICASRHNNALISLLRRHCMFCPDNPHLV